MYHSGNLSLTYAVHSGIMLFMDMDACKSVELSGVSQPYEVALAERDPQTGVTPGVGSVLGSIPMCQ